MELLEKFGINGWVLLAQAVNFLIVFLILWRFAYRPILRLLESRTKKIEKGLKDAEKSQHALTQAQEEKEKILQQARKDAQKIMQDAEKRGQSLQEELHAQTQTEIAAVREQVTKDLAQQKDAMMNQVRSEIADLVIAGIQKFFREKPSAEIDRQGVEKIISSLDSSHE